MITQCSVHVGGSITNDQLISHIDNAWTKWVTLANLEIRPNCGVDTIGVLGGPFPIEVVSFAELAHVKGGFKHGKVLAAVWTHRRMCEMVARLRNLHDPASVDSRCFRLHNRQWTRLQLRLNKFHEEGSMPWAISILQDIKSTWEAPEAGHIALFEAWAAILKQAARLLADTCKKNKIDPSGKTGWKLSPGKAPPGLSCTFGHRLRTPMAASK